VKSFLNTDVISCSPNGIKVNSVFFTVNLRLPLYQLQPREAFVVAAGPPDSVWMLDFFGLPFRVLQKISCYLDIG